VGWGGRTQVEEGGGRGGGMGPVINSAPYGTCATNLR
jgi:hypothetical protein